MESAPYLAVKVVHTLLTIVAVGFNISYNIWLRQAATDPDKLAFALHGIKVLDDRFANPCYILLAVTGVILAAMAGIRFTTFWLWLSTLLWIGIIVVAYAAYTPALRNQIALLQTVDPNSPSYVQAARRVALLGQGLALVVVIILVLMIAKPVL